MSHSFVEQLIAKVNKRVTFAPGSCLFHQDDQVRSVFIIENGLVELTRHQRDGASIILQRATCKTIIAEASVYSSVYHCDAVIGLPTSLLRVPKTVFLELLREDETFSNLWAEHLAIEVQSSRYRIEILSRKTVAERLDGWLAWKGSRLSSKGQWKSLALQIGVSPEALYRELAKRRDKG